MILNKELTEKPEQLTMNFMQLGLTNYHHLKAKPGFGSGLTSIFDLL
jgi:hypothetical protein